MSVAVDFIFLSCTTWAGFPKHLHITRSSADAKYSTDILFYVLFPYLFTIKCYTIRRLLYFTILY